jgi:hypothetical protein
MGDETFVGGSENLAAAPPLFFSGQSLKFETFYF